MARSLAIAALALASCNRGKTISVAPPDASAPTEPAPSATTRVEPSVSPDGPHAYADPPHIRVGSAGDTHVLRAHEGVVRAHFGGDVPLDLQIVDVRGDRRALLVTAAEGDAKPFLLVVDARQNLLWSRERPLAGIRPGVRQVTVCAGPDGEVLAVWHDTESGVVAARRWAADGGLLADFQVMDSELCDALAALYWPGHGWVIVASHKGSARAQLLGERGARSWGHAGRIIGPAWRAAAPLGLALDGEDGVVLVQPGYAANGLQRDVPDRFFATRLDDGGRPVWPAALDLGEAPRPGKAPFPKPELALVDTGVVRARLTKGTTDALVPYEVEITSAGRVLVR